MNWRPGKKQLGFVVAGNWMMPIDEEYHLICCNLFQALFEVLLHDIAEISFRLIFELLARTIWNEVTDQVVQAEMKRA